MTKLANIAVDIPITKDGEVNYYYLIPDEINDVLKPGMVVHVPFGGQELSGYVLDIIEKTEQENLNIKFKSIYQILLKQEVWDKKFLKLAKWISKYYLTGIGTVLSASISSDLFSNFSHEVELLEECGEKDLSKEEIYILDKLNKSKNKKLSYKSLLEKSKITKTKFYKIINELKHKNYIKISIKQSMPKNYNEENIDKIILPNINLENSKYKNQITLNEEQLSAYNEIKISIDENKFNEYLLYGVTGSGKTEVYIKLIEEVIKKNKTIIYLVPEIYLVPQIYERLATKFNPESIVIWHSSLTKKYRFENWKKLLLNKDDKIKIILGARSAILSPIKNLGLIIIDEAHEATYKQNSPAPRYNALKVALKRAEIENCPLILGTATPNIEDYFGCKNKSTVLTLSKRIKDISMPTIHLVDLKNEFPKQKKHIISNALKGSIEEALKKNEQIILLLNRRGYSNSVICLLCGSSYFCKNCSVPMIYHKNLNQIICHHCGYENFIKNKFSIKCQECNNTEFQFLGIGTQQLEEEIKKLFPLVKTIRVDKDQLKRKDEYIKLWEEFSSGKANILIGTQLIAKGIDLPNVTVVGVISADSMLNFPDYISFEKGFQLITQVSGRAGRGDKPGNVFIQSYNTENEIFKFIKEHDYKSFYEKEINHRIEHQYPPYVILVRLIFQSLNDEIVNKYSNETLTLLKKINNENNLNVIFLGPSQCFFSKLHGKYRYHILCKIKNENEKEILFSILMKKNKKNSNVDLVIDVDSINLL